MKTYLYGIGQRTKDYLLENPQIKIAGLLDGYQNTGNFFDYKIFDIKNLESEQAQIIIVARKASEKIIYDRIKGFCEKNGIDIYDTDGNLLKGDYNEIDLSNPFFNKDILKMMKEIVDYEIISFDIFDTLLKRSTVTVEGLFQSIENKLDLDFKFAQERIKAEKQISYTNAPTIEDIYHQLANNINKEYNEISYLIDKEIEEDRHALHQNASMVSLYKHAVKQGKKIYLITDMYYHKKTILQILEDNLISGYQDVFISCEYKTGKNNQLFDIYKSKVKKNKLIHIGDAEYEDYVCANKHGIQGCLIKELPKIINAYEIGYIFLGPMLYQFALWLRACVIENDIDGILFVSRDGYLIKQIYDSIEKKADDNKLYAQSKYLLTSRSLLMLTSLRTEEDIISLQNLSFDGTSEEMLRKRFMLNSNEIRKNRNNLYDEGYILEHKSQILKRSEELRQYYLRYLNSIGIKERRVAIVDFVSTGTCHLGLEKLLNMDLYGFYFERVESKDYEKQELKITDYTSTVGCETLKNYFYLEPMIKEINSSLRYFNSKLEPIFEESRIDKKQADFIEKIQNGVMQYVKKRLNNSEITKFDIDESKKNINMVSLIGSRYIKVDEHTDLINFDELSNRRIKLQI